MSKLNCTEGNYQCGGVCIPEANKCVATEVATDASLQFAGIAKRAYWLKQMSESGTSDSKSGAFGTVKMDKERGLAFKQAQDGFELGKNESLTAQAAAKLGVGSIVHYADDELIVSALLDKADGWGDAVSKGLIGADEASKRKFIGNTLSQIAKLHDEGFSHGDMHFGNIFADDELNIKLIDYGMSTSPLSPVQDFSSSARSDYMCMQRNAMMLGLEVTEQQNELYSQLKRDPQNKELRMELVATYG